MTYYNLSFTQNATGISQLWVGVNNNSDGWFIGSLLLVYFILFFMIFSDYDFKDVYLANSFILTIIVGLLFGTGLLSEWVIGIAVANLVISLLVKIFGGN